MYSEDKFIANLRANFRNAKEQLLVGNRAGYYDDATELYIRLSFPANYNVGETIGAFFKGSDSLGKYLVNVQNSRN